MLTGSCRSIPGVDIHAALTGCADTLVRFGDLVLLSEKQELAHLNAGYIMQDLLLKLNDLELDSCWLTFTDSDEIKDILGIESPMDVVAIAAFGYGKKAVKRLRLNIRSI